MLVIYIRKVLGYSLNIKVKPQSNKTIMRECDKNKLLIDLEQPAENDQSQRVIGGLSVQLGIEGRIVSGHTSRRKVMLIEGENLRKSNKYNPHLVKLFGTELSVYFLFLFC